MASTAKKWLMGCAIGCGVFALLGVGLGTGGSWLMMKPCRRAIDTREIPDNRFADQDTYTPSPDGAIPPKCLAAFLQVRDALSEFCEGLTENARQFSSLEELDGAKKPDKREILSKGWDVTKAGMGMGSLMGNFFRLRSEALLSLGMGLGEYTDIYAIVYRDSLRQVTIQDSVTTVHVRVNGRVRRALRGMLQRQLADLERSAAATADDHVAETSPLPDADLHEALRRDIPRLERDPERILWQDDLPPPLALSVQPFQKRLADAYCPAAVSLELTRSEKSFIGIRGD